MEVNNTQGSDFLSTLRAPAEPTSNELGQEEFFKILTTQLQTQDPLDPEGGADFIAQIAQFSSLEGINNLNSTVEGLSSNILSGQSLQATSLLGKDVQISSSLAVLNDKGLEGSININEPTSDLSLNILNESGAVVKKLFLGNHSGGSIEFKWDGITDDGQEASDGNYFIQAEGTVDGDVKALSTNATFQVEGVEVNQLTGTRVNVQGLGSVDFNSIVKVI